MAGGGGWHFCMWRERDEDVGCGFSGWGGGRGRESSGGVEGGRSSDVFSGWGCEVGGPCRR